MLLWLLWVKSGGHIHEIRAFLEMDEEWQETRVTDEGLHGTQGAMIKSPDVVTEPEGWR